MGTTSEAIPIIRRFPPATLMYGQNQLNANHIRMAQKYTRWIYLTQDTYKPGDSDHPNPWDQLSEHLEELCRILNDSERHCVKP